MKHLLLALLFTLLAAGVHPCRADSETLVGMIDPAEEARLSRLWQEQCLRGHKLLSDPNSLELVRGIVRRILSAIDDAPYMDDWQIVIIDDPFPNAYTNGDGTMVVYSGLVDSCTVNGKVDEEMLAGVIGHEIAHTKLHHNLRRIRDSASIQWVVDHIEKITKGSNANPLSDEERAKLEVVAGARFTREQEMEADQLGAFYAATAGYGFTGHIREAETGLVWMKNHGYSVANTTDGYTEVRKRDGVIESMEDHPADFARIAAMKAYQAKLLNVVGEFVWGREMLRVRDYARAIDCFKDVKRVFPQCFEVWNCLAIACHMSYLQSKEPAARKFQAELADFPLDLRERLRGSETLRLAIDCYRQALKLNPHAPGLAHNLAVALIDLASADAAGADDALREAGVLVDQLLAKEPSNPRFINVKGIQAYWQFHGGDTQGKAILPGIAAHFERAAATGYLPAKYNLAVLQLETGAEKEGMNGLEDYLRQDGNSIWADAARSMLKRPGQAGKTPAPSSISSVADVLGIKVGMDRDEVLKILHGPERSQQVSTSTDQSGEILWYYTLGTTIVVSDGFVESVNLFRPGDPAEPLADRNLLDADKPGPTIAGVSVGATLDEMEAKLGKPAQVAPVPGTAEKIYSYANDRFRIDFRVNLLKVRVITLSKRS